MPEPKDPRPSKIARPESPGSAAPRPERTPSEAAVDESIIESFPASDAPAVHLERVEERRPATEPPKR